MNASDIVADRLIQRGIYLERYKAGLNNRILGELEKLEDGLTQELAGALGKPVLNPTYRRENLERLLANTRSVIKRVYTANSTTSARELLRLAANEQIYVVNAINDATGLRLALADLNYDQLKKLTDGTLIQGAPLKAWWDRQGADLQNKFGDQMRQGVLRGETLDQLTGRVRGTQAKAFTDGVMQASKRNAEAIVHTGVQAVANATRRETFDANSDIISAIQWVATLDGRTTHICKALSGKMWTADGHKPIGHDKAFPEDAPHVRCRSTTVCVLKKWDDLVSGQDEAALDAEFKKQLKAQGFTDEQIAGQKRNTRASMDGQVPKGITFDDWLKSKDHAFQDATLGPGRAKLFRDGKITMSDLTNQKNRPLTIAELEKLAQPRPGPAPVELPIKRPTRKLRDAERHAAPSGPVPPAKSEPPLVIPPREVPKRAAPVSNAISVPAAAIRAPSYEATLKVIDTVHDDGGLTTIPLVENRATVNVGGFSWNSVTGAPIALEVSRAGPHPELTLVHEVGHLLDHQALDVRGEFASETSPLMETWRRIVLATATVKTLKSAAAGKKVDGAWPRGAPAEYAELLPLRELWARAYAQFIATQSGNPALLVQMEVANRRLNQLRYWPAEEFEAIALAIATILKAKKWTP